MNSPSTTVEDEGVQGAIPALSLLITRLEKFLLAISCAAVAVTMVVLVIDVAGRYFFNRPLQWAYDFIHLFLLPGMVSAALSDTFRRDGHISIELLYQTLGHKVQRALRLFAAVLIAACVMPIIWLSAKQASVRFQGDVVTAGVVPWPTWIPYFVMSLGFLVLMIRVLCDALALASALGRGTEGVPGESPGRRQAENINQKLAAEAGL